jgi:hypothetical protein
MERRIYIQEVLSTAWRTHEPRRDTCIALRESYIKSGDFEERLGSTGSDPRDGDWEQG